MWKTEKPWGKEICNWDHTHVCYLGFRGPKCVHTTKAWLCTVNNTKQFCVFCGWSCILLLNLSKEEPRLTLDLWLHVCAVKWRTQTRLHTRLSQCTQRHSLQVYLHTFRWSQSLRTCSGYPKTVAHVHTTLKRGLCHHPGHKPQGNLLPTSKVWQSFCHDP